MKKPRSNKLKELPATAICGNDISSSCLYVSALAIIYAGQFAWISLIIVGGVLFLFRKIYGEVVGALPLNGGAYNALLNTTSKSIASMAATLTLLSYMATAVISASEAIHYLHTLFASIPIILSTVVLLSIFMTLSIIGIGESSKVAVVIFIFHLSSLVILTLFCGIFLMSNGFEIFSNNMSTPTPNGVSNALFFGFAAAMLGLSGFESSSNYVEEQAEGVFRKTLRNMWVIVMVLNPLMAFLALSILPMGDVALNQEALLSHMGLISGGSWLSIFISVDAALVLSGAVLTAFVGVNGLIERMTLDRILPQFLLKRNKRGSAYRISIVFFLLCVSILMITDGTLSALAGVYTIAFLSVMTLFGLGNVLLKIRRKFLPRPERSSWLGLIVAIAAVAAAILGNAILNPPYLGVFLRYFIPAFLFITIMLNRVIILRSLLKIIQYFFEPIKKLVINSNRSIIRLIEDISSQEFVYFTKNDDVATLNKVMLYIEKNEHTKKLKVVAILENGDQLTDRFHSDIEVLGREYPSVKIELIEIKGKFGPTLISQLSKKWKIPINFMFIASPGDHFPYRIEQLGGVRLII